VNVVLQMTHKVEIADHLRLLCDRDRRPIAVEVFEGSVHGSKTLPS
jgi:hypothetical protein